MKTIKKIFIRSILKNLKEQLMIWSNVSDFNNAKSSPFEVAFLRIFLAAGAKTKLLNGLYVWSFPLFIEQGHH